MLKKYLLSERMNVLWIHVSLKVGHTSCLYLRDFRAPDGFAHLCYIGWISEGLTQQPLEARDCVLHRWRTDCIPRLEPNQDGTSVLNEEG